MGGTVQRVGQAVGLDKKPEAQVKAEMRAAGGTTTPDSTKATRSEEEVGARMRGARRRARGLLVQESLGGESQTLGGGQNLG